MRREKLLPKINIRQLEPLNLYDALLLILVELDHLFLNFNLRLMPIQNF